MPHLVIWKHTVYDIHFTFENMVLTSKTYTNAKYFYFELHFMRWFCMIIDYININHVFLPLGWLFLFCKQTKKSFFMIMFS